MTERNTETTLRPCSKIKVGRKELPPELRQSVVIRERVRESVKEQFDSLGGKAFLLEVIRQRAVLAKSGRSVRAVVKQVTPAGKPSRETDLDVTASVLALGRAEALALVDNSPAMLEALTQGEHYPRRIRESRVPLTIKAQGAIARFFK